jgi:ABC-2 type transport system permease protein
MFGKIAGFEFRYQLRSPVFWVAGLAFFLLTFAATTVPQIQLGSRGPIHVNAPVAILQLVGIMDVFFIFAITAFVANIVVRDDETGFGPLIRATPISKFDYLMGRFSGAFGAAAILAMAIPLGILAGTFMPGGDPARLGPFRPEDYLYAYFVVVLPTIFVLAASFFALATATRSMMATYVGAVAFLIGYFVLTTLFQKPQYHHLVGLLEPFGIGAVQDSTRYWTTAERDTTLPPLGGVILANRGIWFCVSFALLAVAWFSYRFEARQPRPQSREVSAPHVPTDALPAPHFDHTSLIAMAWRWTRLEMAQVFKSPAFFVLLVLGLLNALASLATAMDRAYFTVLPVTNLMIQTLNLEFAIIPTIVALYYAGELVWRERERRTHEIFGACPAPDWAFVVPKIAAITLVLVALFAISVLAAAGVQAFKGYTKFEWPHYFVWYLVPNAIAAAQLASLGIFVQALSPHKFLGWGVMALILVSLLVLPGLGLEDHLYLYGTSPPVPLSDMNGQGRFWIARAWFELYWSAFALVLSVLAYALWRRGSETRLWPRLARLPRRLAGAGGLLAAFGVAIFAASGAYIFYNTNILNEYRTGIEQDAWTADYERRLYRFHALPMPGIIAVAINVAIYPHDPRVVTTGRFTIRNRTGKPLDQIHLHWARDLGVDQLAVEAAHLKQRFDRFNYVIYALDRPMEPGEIRTISFRSIWEQKGFKNSENITRIVDNGTYVDDRQILPIIGMDAYGLLSDPVKRRRYGLPAELRPPKLEDVSARAKSYNANGTDWVSTDITVSTVADQIPVAPGYCVSDVVRGGRRIARFKSDAPIMYFFSIQSAAYAIKRARWRDIDLDVYYDPHHPYEIERMIRAIRASFDVYTKEFGPYQFRHVSFIEFPGYADFAESYANTVPWSENLGFIQDDRAVSADPGKVDVVTLVAAHELAHQWWGHQLAAANMQGMNMLTETFAQYSAMLVMEHLYGAEHMRNFLKEELDRYLSGRGGEEIEELPLDRVEDQPYIHYRKGAVVMYRLKDTVGEDVVAGAMRRMLQLYAFKGPPFPASSDFLKILRTKAGPKYDALITDLFDRITLYDLRATSATGRKRPDGRYDVTVTVDAHKFYADGTGAQKETSLDEEIPIGAFLASPGELDFGNDQISSLRTTRIVSGVQRIHLVTSVEPKFAGIDPYNEWINRNPDNTIAAVLPARVP